MTITASIPKGTRDFLPVEVRQRNYVFESIRKVFEKYGFAQIETPAMEKHSTLTGKYGEEGDRLIFKILPRGRKLEDMLQSKNDGVFLHIEDALRYDLTVPFARFVVQHQNEITFPFKRYQIQPVWRADRPQKGRYREFYQCDADIIGSNSLLNELDLIRLIDEVFTSFNIRTTIKLNNRKILAALAEHIDKPENIIDLTVAIDKIDKIGKENVLKELREKGFDEAALKKVEPVLAFKGNSTEKLTFLKDYFNGNETGLKGIEELSFLFDAVKNFPLKSTDLEMDNTLARGLDYYTGTIIEVVAQDTEIGSICGGGRYDNLTGIFGLKDISGVGIAFGADRIFDVLLAENKFPAFNAISTRVLIINFGEENVNYALKALSKLREAGIASELYPDNDKMKKQMKYADTNKIPFVLLAGENERKEEKYMLKNMQSGEQEKLELESVIEKCRQKE